MKVIFIIGNALLPIIIQLIVLKIIKGVSGGDLFDYLVMIFAIVLQGIIILFMFRNKKEYLKLSLIGILIGIIVCICLFYNYNLNIEKQWINEPHSLY